MPLPEGVTLGVTLGVPEVDGVVLLVGVGVLEGLTEAEVDGVGVEEVEDVGDGVPVMEGLLDGVGVCVVDGEEVTLGEGVVELEGLGVGVVEGVGAAEGATRVPAPPALPVLPGHVISAAAAH